MSQVGKLGYVDSKLGAPSSGQQTTRIIFNTITNPGTTSSLSFFKNFQGLSNGQTNLTQNKLDSMESMVVKSIWLAQINTAQVPSLAVFGGEVQQVVSIIVGNQVVVKDLPIHFNQGETGQAFDRLHANAGVDAALAPSFVTATEQSVQPCEIRLLTDIVIPPQVAFEVRIDSNAAVYGGAAVVCALSGYGKIFSAGSSF
jgi:hypothetical protein